MQSLASQITYACGTVRSNRKLLPPDIMKEKMKKGEAKFWKWNDLTAVRWKDKRDVLLLSTIHCNEMVEIPARRDEDEPIYKPKLICDYNKYMNGVDKCDQFLSYYALSRKSKKWWKKVFFRMVEVSVLNAMVLYFKVHPALQNHRQAHKAFRHTLVHQLVQHLLDARASPLVFTPPGPGRRSVSDEQRLKGKHFPETSPSRKDVLFALTKNGQMDHIKALRPKHTALSVKSTCVRTIALPSFTHNPSTNCHIDIQSSILISRNE